MSLATRLNAFAQAIGTDIKDLRTTVGSVAPNADYKKMWGMGTQSGPANAVPWVYNVASSCYLDLTPGTWRVELGIMLYANAADYYLAGIYNETDAVAIAQSYGEFHYVSTAAVIPLTNVKGGSVVTVTKNTRIRIQVIPSGASTATTAAPASPGVAFMEAWRTGGVKGDTGGNATVPIDPWHIVGAVGEPAKAVGWTTDPSDPVRFRKDPFGRVWIRGIVTPGGGWTGNLFTLPASHAQANTLIFDVLRDSGAAGAYVSVYGAAVTAGGTALTYYLDFSFDTNTVTQMPTGPQGPTGAAGAPGGTIGAFDKLVKPPTDWFIPAATTAVPGLSITVPTTGDYKVAFTGDLATGSANGYIIAWLAVNGVVPSGTIAAVLQTYSTTLNMRAPFNKEWIVSAMAGDVLTIQMSNSGHASNNVSGTHTSMQVSRSGGPKGDKGDPGGIGVVKTLDWNTATTPNLYRSTNDFLEKTLHGPGDTLNPPNQAGIVFVHEDGTVVQRVYDLATTIGYTRFFAAGVWSAWSKDLTRPDLLTDAPLGGPTAIDGDERYFQNAAMKIDGAMWGFRYDSTAPSGKPKWCYTGGSKYLKELSVLGTIALNANVWVAGGPITTIPLSGDYVVEWTPPCHSANAPASGLIYTGLYINGVRDDNTISSMPYSAAPVHLWPTFYKRRTFAQSDTVQMGAVSTTGGFTVNGLVGLSITPVRVVM